MLRLPVRDLARGSSEPAVDGSQRPPVRLIEVDRLSPGVAGKGGITENDPAAVKKLPGKAETR